METIYCSIDARRLTQRASGGEETVRYAFVPAAGRRGAAGRPGKVVDLAAWQRARAMRPAPAAAPARGVRVRRKSGRLLDLCASGAAAVVSLAAAARLFTL